MKLGDSLVSKSEQATAFSIRMHVKRGKCDRIDLHEYDVKRLFENIDLNTNLCRLEHGHASQLDKELGLEL